MTILTLPTPLKTLAETIRTAWQRTEHGRQEWIEGTLELAAALAEARGRFASNRAFSHWLVDNELDVIGADDRAALVRLAEMPCMREILERFADGELHPDTIWRIVKQEDWPNSRVSASSEIPKTADDGGEIPADAPEPTPGPGNSAAAPQEAAEKGTPMRMEVSKQNAAAVWGELAERLFAWFTHEQARARWNELATKRHGRQVAEFAIDQLECSGLTPPVTTALRKISARLVLPWLASPLADEYDLGKPKAFERFKADLPLIKEVCRPVFAERKFDKGNTCARLLHQAKLRQSDAKRQTEIAARREAERVAVNGEKHPPIVVHGLELWPDGDQSPELRLSYDAARFAFLLWRELDAAIATGIPLIAERASFWRQRQRLFHGLDFAPGAALSNFWHRCGTAMAQNPTGESHCQPLIRMGHR